MPSKIQSTFAATFGKPHEYEAIAPGRINLIGEHTDYNDGFVFPVAIDREIRVVASKSMSTTELRSLQTGQGQSFDANSVEPGQVAGWVAYAAGMAWVLRRHTGKSLPNLAGVVDSTLPMGSGVSSSAAIELAFGVLWNRMAGLGLDSPTLALLAQKCENEFVGVNCGIMDQMASAMGRQDQAMFLDTRSLEIHYANVPTELKVILCDTKKPRALTESAYNERRSQCEEAARLLGVAKLRDANQDQLILNRDRMDEVVYRRARHVISENERCVQFKSALERGDLDEIGALMRASHVSLRDDYEVSCTELDAMAEACWNASGCIGARMTGAGFGGACVALVKETAVDSFVKAVALEYSHRTGIQGEYTTCRATHGARMAD